MSRPLPSNVSSYKVSVAAFTWINSAFIFFGLGHFVVEKVIVRDQSLSK